MGRVRLARPDIDRAIMGQRVGPSLPMQAK